MYIFHFNFFPYNTINHRGLYGGMGMHLLRSVPNAALMFGTFELTSRWISQYSCKYSI